MDAAAAKSWMATWRTALLHGVGAAVLAMFCFSTANLVPSLTETYWAPIAAVVVLYPDREATKRAAVERFVGTVIGSLIGAEPAHLVAFHRFVEVSYGVACALLYTVVVDIVRRRRSGRDLRSD